VSDSDAAPDSPDPEVTRKMFWRVAHRDEHWAIREVLPEAMGVLRALASANHRDLAQDRAREAIASIDALIAMKGKELGLWHD
jgi:hypothetical protein